MSEFADVLQSVRPSPLRYRVKQKARHWFYLLQSWRKPAAF